jgi:hypothetical protein
MEPNYESLLWTTKCNLPLKHNPERAALKVTARNETQEMISVVFFVFNFLLLDKRLGGLNLIMGIG